MEQKNLPDLMHETGSIMDLEKRLEKDYGHTFLNYTGYMSFLQKRWDKRTAERRQQLLETIPTETRFPTLTVEAEGIEYHLHGIVHGIALPGWYPRKNVQNWISKTMNSFYNPWEGENYFYEQNMHFIASLLPSQELRDITQTEKKPESVWKQMGMLALYIPLGIVALMTVPTIFAGAYIYGKVIKKPQGKFGKTINFFQKALTDERYQAHNFEYNLAQQMPEPFALEKEYLSEKGSVSYTLCKSLFGLPYLATIGERSLWTARALQEYGKTYRVKKLHYLGGGAHMTGIAYFLQHPEYSFERLEEWRLAWKTRTRF